MKRVLTAVVLVPFVLLLVFRAPLWLFALAVAGIIVLALHEYLNIAKAAEIKSFGWITYVLALLPIVVLLTSTLYDTLFYHGTVYHTYMYGGVSRWLMFVCLLSPLAFGTLLTFRGQLQSGLASVSAATFGVVYIGGSLSLLVALRADEAENVLIIFTLLVVWGGDIAAYYGGRAVGRHKLAPAVSPNKTWEGAIASAIASVAIAAAVLHFSPQIRTYYMNWYLLSGHWLSASPSRTPGNGPPLVHALVLGLLTNIAAQFGDLFESALKRGAGVKDSGTLLPGHGGILDRIDALLFAIPVVWYYATLTGFLRR
jgi:phosphatidate cytidylyltransferase